MLEFSIITISSFVTMLDEFVKTFSKIVFKKDISKFIPIFSVLFGVILGIVGFYIPNVEMGNNIVEAIFIGISAGSAATGVNQISKQLNKTEPELSTTEKQFISDMDDIDVDVECQTDEENEVSNEEETSVDVEENDYSEDE